MKPSMAAREEGWQQPEAAPLCPQRQNLRYLVEECADYAPDCARLVDLAAIGVSRGSFRAPCRVPALFRLIETRTTISVFSSRGGPWSRLLHPPRRPPYLATPPPQAAADCRPHFHHSSHWQPAERPRSSELEPVVISDNFAMDLVRVDPPRVFLCMWPMTMILYILCSCAGEVCFSRCSSLRSCGCLATWRSCSPVTATWSCE